MGAGFGIHSAIAQAFAVGAVTVPLGKAATRCRSKYMNVHGEEVSNCADKNAPTKRGVFEK
ncbi:hypothetical protein GCM10025791_26410 [Halioxenophilus aromaticivorans]|uniref:Uncharacterized protein n=1 Tax=Halioxenophilus aromaticivorans TaxID=1306992 RepID=A0AAV3U3N9_9ALTE